jgi:cytochrome c-type biogenesis protein CcmH
MRSLFLGAAGVMLSLALLLVLWRLQPAAGESTRRLKAAAQTLRALNDERTGPLRAAIDEMLLASAHIERKGARRGLYAGLAILVLVPLAATALYRSGEAPPPEEVHAAHAAMSNAVAPPIDHGEDMQAAIAKLADKLRQHPDDAEGWALLGRTYKAMQQYAQAHDAFHHAVEAAPEDTDLAREYATAETPNPEPPMTDDGAAPQ